MNTKMIFKMFGFGVSLIFTAIGFMFNVFASFNEDDDSELSFDGFSKEESLGGISQANLYSSDNSHTGSGLNDSHL